MVALTPSDVSTLAKEGDCARDAGDFAVALTTYRSIAQSSVDGALGHFKIGTVYSRMNRDEEAEQSYIEALRLRPNYPDATNNLALLYAKRGEFVQAEQFHRELLADHPDYVESHINLGNLLMDSGRFAEAQYYFSRAAVLRPQSALAHDRLASALKSRGHLTEAINVFKRALELDSSFYRAWNNLGTCYFALGNHAEAERAFRLSLELNSSQSEAWSNWLFLSNFQSLARGEIAERHRRYGEYVRDQCGPLPDSIGQRNLSPGRRLRVGFVSGDFRRHSVAYFLQDALLSINRDQFELYAYSTCRYEDHITERLRPLFAEWRSLTALSDLEAARRIGSDSIDILVDLSGHTIHNRLQVFGYKPAPIQVSWIGYPNTTGLDCIDYRLTDSMVDPDADEDCLYSERLYRLPGPFLCYTPPEEVASIPWGEQRSRQAFGQVTFGSFNARVKLGEECIALWAKTLLAIPESRLIIKSYHGVDDAIARDDLVARFGAYGIDSTRIVVRGPLNDVTDHLAAYAEIDVALDSYPYNGTTTTCEALWMGVPVITLAGDRHASRVGMALLTRIGFPHWVARTPDEFTAKVVDLVSDRAQLAQLKPTLRPRLKASQLLDGPLMGKQLGEAFRRMWMEYCGPARGNSQNEQTQSDDLSRLNSLIGTSRHEEIVTAARRVLSGSPEQPLALKALTVALMALERTEEAYPVARESARVSPADPEAIDNLGIAASRLKRWAEAAEAFSRALDRSPADPEILDRLATCHLLLGEAAQADSEFARSISLDRSRLDAWDGWLFSANFYHTDRREVFDRHCKFGQMIRSICGPTQLCKGNSDGGRRKLRLGFVSGDLGQHSVTYFLQGPLAGMDRASFELFAYSTARLDDSLTARLKVGFSHWRDIDGLLALTAAELIRQDRIDVLFDLAGHTANNGLAIFAHRPAPIQVSWIGYPNTTGLDCMDYRITDHVVDPDPLDDSFHTEKLVRLERPFLCYTPPDPAPPVADLPCLLNGYLTFGSLNTRAKLSEECIQLWASVLSQLPSARLIIKSYSGLEEDAAREDLVQRFGIDRQRIEIRKYSSSVMDHLAAYHDIDIALDTFPYNGTTTTCEALWMGVPVITLSGDRHASRVGAMLMRQADLDECVAQTSEDFTKCALRLAATPDRLAKIRSSLRQRMLVSPLLDTASMGSHLGAAIHSMWTNYSGGTEREPEASRKSLQGTPANSGHKHGRDDDVNTLMDLVSAQRYEDTERFARRMLLRRPDHQLAVRALSFALIGLRQFEKALPIVKRGVKRNPKDPELLNNFGIIQSELMQWSDAVPAFRSALCLSPDDPEIHRNLGAAYYRMHRWSEAIPSLLKAIELYPGDYIDAIGLLALSLLNDNRNDEALVCFEGLVKAYPTDAFAHYLFVKAALHQCKWQDLGASIERIWAVCSDTSPPPLDTPFTALPIPGVSNDRVRRIALSHAAKMVGRVEAGRLLPVQAKTSRPLRIGYMSGDLRAHPVGYVLPKVIESHDSGRFETWGLSVGPDEMSPARSRLVSAFDHFIDLEHASIGETVSRIRSVPIDILVDLSGWTTHGRQEATALRCAPIQVNWLGYAGTMGLAELADYILADQTVLPIEQADFYSETIAHFPHSFMPVDPWQDIPPPPSRANEGLPESGIVFCSFNSCYKFNPQNFDLWCRLLREVPGSVLWLGSMADRAAINIRSEATARGVEPERIILATFAESRPAHLARMQLADIALDPFPYNSHSSGVEILQAGVPMISLLGETFAGRVGASLLRAAGLADLVTESYEDYFRLAYRLATSPGELVAMKERLDRARRFSPLVDMTSFTRSLEDLYSRMWSDACAGIRRPLTSN